MTTPTATTLPPSPPTSDPGSFSDPNASGGLGLGTSLSGAFGIPTNDLSIQIPGFGGQTLQQMITSFQQAPASVRGPLVAELKAAGYFSGITSGSELDQETTAYARLLRDSIWSQRDPNSTLTDAQQAQATVAAKDAAQPRTIGLGKYPIHLTAPEDVRMTADTIFQSLLGRRATPQEVAAVTDGLHHLEQAQGQTELEQYAGPQESYIESAHGGVLSAPSATTPATTTPAPNFQPAGGAGSVSSVFSGTGTPAGVAPAATTTTSPATPASQPPSGAIPLADGSYIVPPSPIVSTSAPTAGALAYNYAMQNNPNEVDGRLMAGALNAIVQFMSKPQGQG